MSNKNLKAAVWSINAGRWFYARSGLSALGDEVWTAAAFCSKEEMALDLWRKLGNSCILFEPSPGFVGCACGSQVGRAWEDQGGGLLEIMAFSDRGEAISPKGLVDFGAQLAKARGERGDWEWKLLSWRFRDWNGFGPVPGTGKRSWRRRFRCQRLGAGARKVWMGEVFEAARDVDELDGRLWSRGSHAAAISQLEDGGRAIGADLLGWFDDSWRARQGNSWKNAKRKRVKAWDRC